MTAHRCHACGYESRDLWWDVDAGEYWCWRTEKCEQRIAERNDELEKLRNEGSLS